MPHGSLPLIKTLVFGGKLMERKDLKPLIEIARLNSDKELLLCK